MAVSDKVSVRIPPDLLERVDAADGSRTDVVVAALRSYFDPGSRPATGEGAARAVEALHTTIEELTRDLAEARRQEKAGVPVPRVDAVATKTIGHHAAGPVYEPVPRNLSGDAVGYRPKAGWKGKEKTG